MTWHLGVNTTDSLLVPVVRNSTIAMKVRLPGSTTVLGLRFRRPSRFWVFVLYSAANIFATSIIPIPIATSFVPLACILFGLVGGMVINVGTTCVGAYLALVLVRFCCRPRFVRMLGKHHSTWVALDRAIALQCAPRAPKPWPPSESHSRSHSPKPKSSAPQRKS